MKKAIKNPYEVLGVDPISGQAEVKKAYRKKAAAAHPDKGGSADEMADLNTAYAIIGDPERRLLYDATGEDGRMRPVDEDARNVLLECFTELLAKNVEQDCLGQIERGLKQKLAGLEQQREQMLDAQKNLKKRRPKIKVKRRKDNLFHMVVDQQMRMIEGQLLQNQRGLDVLTRALEMLDDYSSTGEPESKPTMVIYSWTGTSM